MGIVGWRWRSSPGHNIGAGSAGLSGTWFYLIETVSDIKQFLLWCDGVDNYYYELATVTTVTKVCT